MEEIWKDIKGYEGYYQVSSLGQIKSLPRIITDKKGFSKMKPGILLSQSKDSQGYHRIGLSKNAVHTSCIVHRIVVLTFLAPVEFKEYVNHIDANKDNNTVSNLEWCSSYENTMHGLKLGIMNTARGNQKPNCVLTEQIVREVKIALCEGVRLRDLAIKYKVNRNTLREVQANHNWKWVIV